RLSGDFAHRLGHAGAVGQCQIRTCFGGFGNLDTDFPRTGLGVVIKRRLLEIIRHAGLPGLPESRSTAGMAIHTVLSPKTQKAPAGVLFELLLDKLSSAGGSALLAGADHTKALFELVDLTTAVGHLLGAGVEGVALGAHVHEKIFATGGARVHDIPA